MMNYSGKSGKNNIFFCLNMDTCEIFYSNFIELSSVLHMKFGQIAEFDWLQGRHKA